MDDREAAIEERRRKAVNQRFTASHSNYPTWDEVGHLLTTCDSLRAEVERLKDEAAEICEICDATIPFDIYRVCGRCHNKLAAKLATAHSRTISECIEKVKAKQDEWDAKGMSVGNDVEANRYFAYKHAAFVLADELETLRETQAEAEETT